MKQLFTLVRIAIYCYFIGRTAYLGITKFSYGVHIFLILLLIAELLIIVKHLLKNTKLKETVKSLSISALMITCLLLVFEIGFMFVPRSHAVAGTHAALLWTKMYWKPINSLGYRDREFPTKKTKPIYFFVGDSYTAGYGIKDVSDRYSNILAASLPRVEVLNLGVNAIDTKKEFTHLMNVVEKTSLVPDKIFLQYYGNDIDVIAGKNNEEFRNYKPTNFVSPFLVRFIRSSYLLDFMYWMFPQSYGSQHIQFIKDAYSHEPSLTEHYKDLQRFVDYSQEVDAELVVIIVPFVHDLVENNDVYTEKIKRFFENQNIKVLDVGSKIKHLPLKDMVVNNSDSHASVKVNRIIADELLKLEK